MLRSRVLSLLLLAPVVPAAALADQDHQRSADRPDSVIAMLEDRVPGLLRAADIPGLALAVIHDGRLAWTAGFGERRAGEAQPVTPGTIFEAASLSKTVFGYAVLRLARRGEIDLDRPLLEYIDYPRLAVEPRARAITARHVLSHTTGLPNWADGQLELAFEPGTGFRYSGEGFVLLQRAAEHVTRLPLEALVRREVFLPLGMDRSTFVWRDRTQDDVAWGHDRAGEARAIRRVDTGNAAASLLTTAEDYARFLVALLRGEGLEEGSLRAIIEPVRSVADAGRADPAPDVWWGLGWGLAGEEEPRYMWHWGDNGAFKAFVSLRVPGGDGFVYFANSSHGLAIAGELAGMMGQANHPGIAWMDYEAWDDPGRLARTELRHLFRELSEEAGMQRYRDLRQQLGPGTLDAGWTIRLARLLLRDQRPEAAAALLREARAGGFEDVELRELHGQALLQAGEHEAALDLYHSLAADTDRDYVRHIAWIRETADARRQVLSLPEDLLRAYTGDYGPRHVTLRDGRLVYHRDGGDAHHLVPLSESLFAVEGNETFRLRFVRPDEDRPATAVVGIYFDGRSDESARN